MDETWKTNNLWLKENILLWRSGSDGACFNIIEKFSKLMHMYSNRLKDEDSFYDLTLVLLESIHKLDLDRFENDGDSIQRYLAVVIKRAYIGLCKNKHKEDIMLDALQINDCLHSNVLIYHATNNLLIEEMLNACSPRQRTVMIYHYIYLYSIADIAKMMGISRMSVNGLKLRGIHALRIKYSDLNTNKEGYCNGSSI